MSFGGIIEGFPIYKTIQIHQWIRDGTISFFLIFDTEVKLMTLRTGEETLIEPHAFNKDEFKLSIPIVYQIINNGLKLSF